MKTVAIAGYEKNVPNYVAAIEAVGLWPLVTLDRAEAAACDGLLLPGGGDIDPPLYGAVDAGSRDIDRPLDEAQLAALDAFVQAKKPVLGICKGHQVINVYFGGGIIQDLNAAVVTAHRYDGQDSIHEIVTAESSLLASFYGPRLTVNSAHHQGLGTIGAGLRATAWSPDGVVEAVEHDTLPVLGTQFHPERMCFSKARPDTADGAAIFRWFRDMIG